MSIIVVLLIAGLLAAIAYYRSGINQHTAKWRMMIAFEEGPQTYIRMINRGVSPAHAEKFIKEWSIESWIVKCPAPPGYESDQGPWYRLTPRGQTALNNELRPSQPAERSSK